MTAYKIRHEPPVPQGGGGSVAQRRQGEVCLPVRAGGGGHGEGVDLAHLHDYVGQERPTALFEQKLKDPNMETQLVEVSQQYQIIQNNQEEKFS